MSAHGTLTFNAEYRMTGATLLRVGGVLDHTTADAFEQRVLAEAQLSRTQPAQLLLDLFGITYLDSVGLEALLRAQRKLTSASGTLGLCEPNPGVVWLLHQAHLDGASWLPLAL